MKLTYAWTCISRYANFVGSVIIEDKIEQVILEILRAWLYRQGTYITTELIELVQVCNKIIVFVGKMVLIQQVVKVPKWQCLCQSATF